MNRLAAADNRRGTVLIVTMWIVLALSGLVLVFCQWARVEALASANRRSAIQADAIARGALQYVLASVDGANGRLEELDELDWQQRQVGDGFFWVLRANLEDDGQLHFGLRDEAASINLNSASSEMLLKIPGMTAELADAIIEWRQSGNGPGTAGTESEYYLLRDMPYYIKDGPFEAVEEVLLLRGATEELLYGDDRNRNGILHLSRDASRSGPLQRGLLDYATVYSIEPNTDAEGRERINVNSRDTGDLADLLRQAIPDDRVFSILERVRRRRPFENVLDFYFRIGLRPEEFRPIADRLTTVDREELIGLVNVNTAPRDVLMCLPQLDESDVDALLNRREAPDTDLSSIAWVAEALPQEKAVVIGSHITARSYQFSANIVAVSEDGRAYRRYLAVVDTRHGTPRVLRWQPLTHLGWPLEREILDALRGGEFTPHTHTLASYR